MVRVMAGGRSCTHPATCLWVILVLKLKETWVYITAVMVLEIVQYSFCKSPLELVIVVKICIIYFSCLAVKALHCVSICRD